MQPDTVSKDGGTYIIQYMPFNSTSSDFGAVFWKNGVVFTSNRANSAIRYTSEDNKLLTDIFFTENNKSDKWKQPVSFSSEINSRYNDGPLSFSFNGDTLYFNRNSDSGKLQILYSILNNGKWTAPIGLPFNSASYSVAHPCISSSGHELYFCSDMPGGEGGKDLYVSRFINNNWSPPENLGKSINTSKDEMFPFISADGELYFASNGHSGMGGLDIFSTEMRNGLWEPVSNCDVFNSSKDDFAFSLDSSSQKGFFSSDRLKEDDNIYYFEILEPSFPLPDTVQENNYCLTIFEESTSFNDTLPYKYVWNLGNGLLVQAKEVYHCFPGPGNYHVYLNVIDTLSSDTNSQQVEYLIELKDHEQLYIACPDTVKAGTPAFFDASGSNLPGYNIKNYFWNFGDGKKDNGMKTEHIYHEPGIYYVMLGSELLTTDKKQIKKSVVKKIIVVKND